MALSGTLNTNDYDGRFYQVKWTATQSINNNSSTINWTVSALGGGTRWFAERTLKVIIAGKTVVDKTDRVERYDGNIASGSFTLTHAADGSKLLPVSIQAAVYASTINCVANTTFELDQIPKQAIITGAENFTDEDNPTITYNNPAGNAVTSLDVAIGWTGADDIAYRSVSKTGTSYTFNFTSAERIALQDAVNEGKNTKIVTFYLRTVINGTTYYSSIQKTLSIANALPVLNPIVTEQNSEITSITGGNGSVVLGHSQIYCNSNYTLRKRATLSSIRITNGSNIINSATGTFNNIGSNRFIFEIVDSRGNRAVQIVTKSVVNYVPISVHATFNEFTTDGTASFNISGSYFNDNFGRTNNYLSLSYKIAPINGSYSIQSEGITRTLSGNSYTGTVNVTGLDYTKAYKFIMRAEDELGTVETAEIRFTGRPIFEWGKNDFKFNVPVTFAAGATGADIPTGGGSTSGGTDLSNGGTINGDLTVNGGDINLNGTVKVNGSDVGTKFNGGTINNWLRLGSSNPYTNAIYFGASGTDNYIRHSSTDSTGDTLRIGSYHLILDSSDITILRGSNYEAHINPQYGTWTPILDSNVISSYTTQQGWYQRVEDVITIGFFIKATCKSGFETTNIKIIGNDLPGSYPKYSAAGGGMCSGAYVSAGFNFQTFVLGTDRSITTRVQACNNTSAGNLATSASGCFYPSGGGELTLSGTITYITS